MRFSMYSRSWGSPCIISISAICETPPELIHQGATRIPIDRYRFITINHAATIGPCGPRPRPPGAAAGGGVPGSGAGAGPRSGWKRYTLCVLVSTQIVFAPANVATVSTTVYLSGESWCTTVTLPSPPFGIKISFFAGSHPRASTREPFLMLATTFPELASTTTEVLLQPEKMRSDALSYAMPVGP